MLNGIIPSTSPKCKIHGYHATLEKNKNLKDGYRWRCHVKNKNGKICTKTWSIRGNKKSWLFNIKINLRELLLALYSFAGQFTVKQLKMMGINWSSNTYTDYSNMFQQISTEEYRKFTKKMKVPVVMMDESLFSKNFLVIKQCGIIHHAIIKRKNGCLVFIQKMSIYKNEIY